jgi:hypothetical protein
VIWSELCFDLELRSALTDKNSEIMGVKTVPEKQYKDRKELKIKSCEIIILGGMEASQ